MGSDEKINSHCIRISVGNYTQVDPTGIQTPNGLEDCCVAFKKRVIDGSGLLNKPNTPNELERMILRAFGPFAGARLVPANFVNNRTSTGAQSKNGSDSGSRRPFPVKGRAVSLRSGKLMRVDRFRLEK
uniref:Uncharacterized protein n=1 Tax=Timema shepardi TaxID=629360 RepID=A0A7R9FW22_TIMSH|nr:unnamed protein product [Timema shepardi]